jgi:serine/threonine protein kinase
MPFIPALSVAEVSAVLAPCGLTVLARIDGGGQGDVFRCDQPGQGPCVAKIFVPEARPRVAAEVIFLSTVQHPAIVRLLSNGDVTVRGSTCPYTVMEYVPGDSLRTRILDGRLVAEPEARRMVSCVAGGLGAMWAAGKVHRDVKPDNVLMEDSGTAKLIDFGIVRHLDLPTMTVQGFAPGTRGYKSPEHDSAIRNPTFKADVYSLGVTTFEAMSGVHPFSGDQDAMTRGAIAADLRSLVTCSDDFAGLLARMLNPRAVMRPGLDEIEGVA